jgi:cell wall-associated NlpC family hydrolase
MEKLMPIPLIAFPIAAAAGLLVLRARRGPDRSAHVAKSFYATEGKFYSFGGGHPVSKAVWPTGSPGLGGGVGWDCSGWVLAVIKRAGGSKLAPITEGATSLWEAAGSPRNGLKGAKPGDLIWWGDPVHHVGFYMGNGWAVSATGVRDTNGNDPARTVKRHRVGAVGSPVMGTYSW